MVLILCLHFCEKLVRVFFFVKRVRFVCAHLGKFRDLLVVCRYVVRSCLVSSAPLLQLRRIATMLGRASNGLSTARSHMVRLPHFEQADVPQLYCLGIPGAMKESTPLRHYQDPRTKEPASQNEGNRRSVFWHSFEHRSFSICSLCTDL
jgi:hypothetical protein